MYALANGLSYNPATGILTWEKSPSANVAPGQSAGSFDGRGYRVVSVGGKRWSAHRLIWTMVNGPIPSGYDIDHINGDRQDNRLENLRLLTRAENNQNTRSARRDSKSGLQGVNLHRRSGLFNARIKLNGISQSLGYFKTSAEAHEAYVQRKREIHPANTI